MPAGLLRRGGALFLDTMPFIGPALLIALLPGVFVPLDRNVALVNLLAVPIVLAGFVYLFPGAALLPNTCGRWAMAVRVVDPRKGQSLVRTLTIGLWAHRGRADGGEPTPAAPGRPVGTYLGGPRAAVRIVVAAPASGAEAMAALGCPHPLVPLITARMDISRAAVAYARGEHGATSATAPAQALVVNDSGTVTLRMDGGRHARATWCACGGGGPWSGGKPSPVTRRDGGSRSGGAGSPRAERGITGEQPSPGLAVHEHCAARGTRARLRTGIHPLME